MAAIKSANLHNSDGHINESDEALKSPPGHFSLFQRHAVTVCFLTVNGTDNLRSASSTQELVAEINIVGHPVIRIATDHLFDLCAVPRQNNLPVRIW